MANFKKAFLKTDKAEGGYVNDPSDSGGETFRGVSRISNPLWAGWPLIDKQKSHPDFKRRIDESPEINSLVEPFFKTSYWDPLKLDLLKDDFAAFLIYDAHVNHGPTITVWVQKILNVMNQNEKLWKDLLEDGVMGPVTVETLNLAIQKDFAGTFCYCFEALRASAFIESTEKKPSNEKFFQGWIRRLQRNEAYKENM